jgi:hypothetical protein
MEYAPLALAFLIGYMLRGLFSYIMTIGRAGVFVDKVGKQVLKLLITVAQDVEFIKHLKYDMIEEAGATNSLKRERNMDEYNFEKWKVTVIESYLANYPPQYRKQFVKFSNWEEAVKHMDDLRTNEKWR